MRILSPYVWCRTATVCRGVRDADGSGCSLLRVVRRAMGGGVNRG